MAAPPAADSVQGMESELLLEQSVEPPARSSTVIQRMAGRVALLMGAAAFAAALYSHLAADSSMMAMGKLRKPFQLYAGDLPMPGRANQYDGITDERHVNIVDNNGMSNVFVLGDWGATLPNHDTFGFKGGGDQKAQLQVANAIKIRAAWAKPQYVLNVGDNFYVEGLEFSCNAPPSAIYGAGSYGMRGVDAFSQSWQWVYGPVANVPWLSVLGNHDYGGWRMDKGWPQQIGYSFVNHNWIMPARYYMKRMQHSNFNVDVFNVDSNHFDAKYPNEGKPDHNICSHHNLEQGVGTCAANGGMSSIQGCRDWFWGSDKAQKKWLEEKLAASDATWKVVNTHFPCGYDGGFYKRMKAKYGLDLLVTGHRHQQELWWPGTKSKFIQDFMRQNEWDGSAPACFVTGGGGGIIHEAMNYADSGLGTDLLWYGFFHLTLHKDWMKIELVGTDGRVAGNVTIHPHGSQAYLEEAKATLPKPSAPAQCLFFCGDMNNELKKVCPKGYEPWLSCAGCEGCRSLGLL